jgi:citrate synthase
MAELVKGVPMGSLKDKLAEKIPVWREEINQLAKEYGEKQVSTVNVSQLYGGARGVVAMICDTSTVPADKGLIIRGIPISQLKNKLPEEIFYLLCTGELPDKKALVSLQKSLESRSKVPAYVWKVLGAMPKDSHPMAMLDTAILVMERESKFRKMYDAGIHKSDYWIPTLEDSLDLLARIPVIAAGIYRMKFKKGKRINWKKGLDLGANFAHMLGIKDKKDSFAELIRFYMVIHSDHEGGTVSSHSTSCVASALSDAYYAVSAGLNGLAGPLHGLANQECLNWVLMLYDKFGGVPSDDQLRQFAWDTLKSDKVIPGYGHAVLRITDPRFDAFLDFGAQHMPDDPMFQIVCKIYRIVPDVLREQGKAKDPWPNVDAASGALLYHYGMKEFSYYTVMFAVSRMMGLAAQMVIGRAMGYPIERPKSVTTEWIKKQVTQ